MLISDDVHCLFVCFNVQLYYAQTTATHQLKTAVMSVAFAGRSLFLSPLSDLSMKTEDTSGFDVFSDILMISLSNALLGMDANDPPKTLATMQLLGSIFSNVSASFLAYMF